MKKIKTIATSVLALAAIGLGITTLTLVEKPSHTAVKGAETVTQQGLPAQTTELSFIASEGTSILDQLKAHASVETQHSSYGPFVTAINGVKGGADNTYWNFYVDDVLVQKSAAYYLPNGGEKITWKLE
ncbi:MAG TPA: DUF4430 domain-containing protein [Candidatus Saccharimonadales bacterium]|nr:DUF4430 domain-containing protein [Candidatus Saccharimonadales bacterium]